ncbi:MAG TPA: phospholipase D-like domain-containing protein [Terriglobales bacterium]|nr:phospholipase D-like domain-containing protein [Terriglobales bacterium]
MASRRKRRYWRGILATIVVAALTVLAIANLSLGDKKIDTAVVPSYAIADPQFRRTLGAMLGPQLLAGNHVEALRNGDEIFPAMLDAIRGARSTVTFETYIYWSGRTGEAFTEALIDRARAGVSVLLLFDAVGSGKIDKGAVKRMAAAGVQVRRYNPLRWNTLATMNNRTHRKLLVVDGRVGFTGGVGIADEWTGDGLDPKRWRDTHFRITGPAVAQMQAAFMENWIETTGEVSHDERYFPEIEPAGDDVAQVFVSSPGGGGESVQLMYLLSIAAARKSIQLSASYFVPDNVEVRMLTEAARRGVRVQVLVPGPLVDTEIVRRASRASWGELLRGGVEIYEYLPALFHVKTMVVDHLWTSVGSTNFDTRSFSVNDEANLNVLSGNFARAQERIFEDDLARSRQVTLQAWEARPWSEKLWEQAMGLLSSQL